MLLFVFPLYCCMLALPMVASQKTCDEWSDGGRNRPCRPRLFHRSVRVLFQPAWPDLSQSSPGPWRPRKPLGGKGFSQRGQLRQLNGWHPQKPLFARSERFAWQLWQTLVDGEFRKLRVGSIGSLQERPESKSSVWSPLNSAPAVWKEL